MAGRNLLAPDPTIPSPPPSAASAAPERVPTGVGRNLLAPPPPTPEEQRAQRLRAIAKASFSSPGFGGPGASSIFGDAFTLGLQKPTAGLAEGLGGMLNHALGIDPNTTPQSFSEGWKAGTGGYQDYLDEAKKNAGWGGTAASIAGGVLAGGPAAVQQGLWPVVKQAATLGGIEGAARNSEDWQSAAEGGLTNAATAAATAAGLHGLLSLPGWGERRAAAREAARGTPPDVLRQQAQSIYKKLDEAGVAYDANQATDFADNLISDLKQSNWSPQGVHSSLNGIVGQIEDLRGQPMSLEKLQQIRGQLTSESKATEPEVRRIAGRMLGSIDGFVGNENPALSSIPGDQIAPLWGEARRLWRSANTAEDIGWRVGKAESRAARTNSGQNTENAIRQNIGQALDKAEQPRRFNPYNEAELAQMRRVVEGSPIQNALRWTGNQVAGIPAQTIAGGAGMLGLGMGGGGVAGSILGGLAGTAATQGAGHLLKRQAAKMAQNEADNLIRLIATGSLEKAPQMLGPPTRAALAQLMARQAAERGAGLAAGNQANQLLGFQ